MGFSGQVEVPFWKALGATEVYVILKTGANLEKTKGCGEIANIALAE